MKPETVAASLRHYAKKYLPLMNEQSSFNNITHVNPGTTVSFPTEADQRILLEEIVNLFPNKKGVTSSKFLLRLLRTAMLLHAGSSCRENLEKRMGAQLDQAAHPWLTDIEREQLCRLMNCQKLSLEASIHAAQNERLPLRVIVQVLFFEQLRLRTSISGWFFVSENLENSQNPSGNLGLPKKDGSCPVDSAQDHAVGDDMREHASELEKECSNMKEELQKLVKTKRKWKIFSKKFSFRQKLQPCNSKKWCDLKEPESSNESATES
ncbi:hypothetical protein P3X46_009694 [Hevea brasiliensis]|uniref:NPH3 domain-containing protein n=1 Tax=Hevea brasiliensis TaxID=3981 RepID=A0ABQ9MMM9_HEVBR|nr:hypothetical protein P3X46_009694 [Hevea brasiliensis]